MRAIIEGDRYTNKEENFGSYGYGKKEISGDEIIDVEEADDEKKDDLKFDEEQDD